MIDFDTTAVISLEGMMIWNAVFFSMGIIIALLFVIITR